MCFALEKYIILKLTLYNIFCFLIVSASPFQDGCSTSILELVTTMKNSQLMEKSHSYLPLLILVLVEGNDSYSAVERFMAETDLKYYGFSIGYIKLKA